ncbi:MAG: baeRF3 domain-containing protein, partial [Flavitalea sp.]
SGSRSQIYLGNTIQFLRIVSNTAENIDAVRNDTPERVGIFSDPAERKEIMLDKFLHHVDNGLGHIVKAYALPLFVMGTDRIIGHFRKITHHSDRVINYIHGNFEDATEAEIREAIAPYVADWKKIKQDDLLLQLDAAMGAKKLTTGIQEVWKEATCKKGRLLVVEKNYMYPAQLGDGKEIIYPKDETIHTSFFIKDAVDDIIEKMFEGGGDVEFVDEGVLKDYQRIALIKYY